MKPFFKTLLLYFLLVFLCLINTNMAQADTNLDWTKMSLAEIEGAVPTLISDRYGGIHVFWSQSYERQAVINYAYRSADGSWLINDILAGSVGMSSVTIDDNDILHMIFSRGGSIGYTYAPLNQGIDPWAWAEPTPIVVSERIGASFTHDLLWDEEEVLHLAYTIRIDGDSTLYYTRSFDRGANWESPTELSQTESSEVADDGPQLALGEDGVLHMVWHLRPSPIHYGGAGVFYIRSVDGGESWSSPRRIDRQHPDDFDEGAWLASIAVMGSDEIHVVWDAHAYSGLRRHQWSRDGGLSWSKPQPVMGTLVAQTGFNPMIKDSSGNLYLFAAGTPQWGQPLAVYFSHWTGTNWISPHLLPETAQGNPHYPTVALTEGNLLHVVWTAGSNLWYASARTPGASISPIQPVRVEPIPTMTKPTMLAESADLVSSPMANTPNFPSEPVDVRDINQLHMLLSSLLPALLLVIAVFAYRLVKNTP